MFEPALDDDIPAIVALMNRAYRGEGEHAGWSTEAGMLAGDRTTVDLLRAEISASSAGSLLKWSDEADGSLLGCVWLAPMQNGTWYLGSLAVETSRQNGGSGRMLLAAAEAWVRGRGAVRVRMSVVNVRHALIAWYGRRGYRLTGETAPFPYEDHRFGVPLRDDLCFVILEKDLA